MDWFPVDLAVASAINDKPRKLVKMTEQFNEWEKYKIDNKIYSSEFITKKKSKVDERLKVKVKNKIITKNPRKVTT